MQKILITGAGPNGITGRLIKEYFEDKYVLITPSSKELDLTNSNEVAKFFNQNAVDYVIHCATFRPTSIDESHFVDEELESNLRMFYSLVAHSNKFKKMIYFGSGAEFDKSRDIANITEEEFGLRIPSGKYGFSKYIMNSYARRSANVYNFRLFGTINKYERYTKNVISNLCVKAIKGLPLQLQQDCRFSFVDINDVLPLLDFALNNELQYHDYNIVMNQSYLLSEIAGIIVELSGRRQDIEIVKNGLNKEYSASNRRASAEFSLNYISIEESIERVYTYYKLNQDSIGITNIDARWK